MATLVKEVLKPLEDVTKDTTKLASETASVPPEVAKALAQIVVNTIINFREFWGDVGKRGVAFIKKHDSPTELSGQAAVDLIRALESLDKKDAEAIEDLEERYAKDPVFRDQVDAGREDVGEKANEYAAESKGKYSSDDLIDAGVVTVAYLYFVVRDLLVHASDNLYESFNFVKGMLPYIKQTEFKRIIKSAQRAIKSKHTPEEKQKYIVNICKLLVVSNKP